MTLSKFVYGFFKGNFFLRETPEVSSTDSVPDGFYSQKLWGLIFQVLELWVGGPGVGLVLLTLETSLPNFYPPHMDVGPAPSMSSPLLPVWMDVISLIS